MPKAKNDVQDMSINVPLQKISVKVTFYFNIFTVNFELFLRITIHTNWFVLNSRGMLKIWSLDLHLSLR